MINITIIDISIEIINSEKIETTGDEYYLLFIIFYLILYIILYIVLLCNIIIYYILYYI